MDPHGWPASPSTGSLALGMQITLVSSSSDAQVKILYEKYGIMAPELTNAKIPGGEERF